MSHGADLFVVCKNPECRSEVSPYITECPYCGTRLRKRAPRLDRGGLVGAPRRRRLTAPNLTRLRSDEIPGIRGESRPYATLALVVVTCVTWIVLGSGLLTWPDLVVNGSLNGQWWRALTTQFTYLSGVHQFGTLLAIAVFGWLLERRHGPIALVLVFLLGGMGGTMVAALALADPLAVGGTGAALGLLAAWAVPDLLARRTDEHYEADLLGVGAFALALVLMALARAEVSWVATLAGGALGLLCGISLARLRPNR